jgi:transposase-like protein
MQLNITLDPPDATPIAKGFSVSVRDGKVTYFSNLMPFKSHDADDRQARALALAELRVDCGLPANKIAEAMGISRSTLMGHCKTYRQYGSAGFFKPRKEKKRTAISESKRRQAEALLSQGLSASKTAGQLGIAVSTLTHNIRAGKVKGGKPGASAAGRREKSESRGSGSHRSERDRRDQEAPMGWACQGVQRKEGQSSEEVHLPPETAPGSCRVNALGGLRCSSSIIPDHGNGLLKVRALGLGRNCVDRSLKPLLGELIATETAYRGSEAGLRTVCRPEPDRMNQDCVH